MATIARARGAQLAVGAAAAVGMAAASSADDTSAAECYSRPVAVPPEHLDLAVELLKPGGADVSEMPGTLVTSTNADGHPFHDVDYGIPDDEMLALLAVARSGAADPNVVGALGNHRPRQPIVGRMMAEQPSIRSHLPTAEATDLEQSAVLVEPDWAVQSVSSFGQSVSESLLVEANESLKELRAENAALREEKAALREENAVLRAEVGQQPGAAVTGPPVRTAINICDNGRISLTLRLRAPVATETQPPRDENEPEWLEGARRALAQPPEYSAPVKALWEQQPAATPRQGIDEETGRWRPEWDHALVVGAVVIVGTLALALARNPKLASVAAKKAAVAMRLLVATFRIPL